jgi:hypothetical protein
MKYTKSSFELIALSKRSAPWMGILSQRARAHVIILWPLDIFAIRSIYVQEGSRLPRIFAKLHTWVIGFGSNYDMLMLLSTYIASPIGPGPPTGD